VAEFLSDAWLADLARAATSAAGPPGVTLVIQQQVQDERAGVAYAIRIADGQVTVVPGHVDAADLTFTQDRATAVAIARGDLSAQVAFMAGRLRIGGDLRTVLQHAAALSAIADIFAEVRDDTTW